MRQETPGIRPALGDRAGCTAPPTFGFAFLLLCVPAELAQGSRALVGIAEGLRMFVQVGCCCCTSAVHLCWLPRSQILEIISQLYLVKLTREKVILLGECYRGKL